jgi:predicted dehydrogenase
MPPIHLSRRRFLGCSAAAGIALAQGQVGEAADRPVRLGIIGVGNRGTSLLRSSLDVSGFKVVAVADPDPRSRQRGQGIVEKATKVRPDAVADHRDLQARADVEAVLVALPCDLHASVYEAAIRAGKHLYAEKPLGLSLAECDRLIGLAESRPDLAFHVGFQKRSNPRYQDGISRLRAGEIGDLLECRAAWTSSNGPVNGQGGWLASRARSGDFMLEQAVHVWDLLLWLKGEPPARAFGGGRRDVFARLQPDRDVTDWYSVQVEWTDGFRASFVQSWIDPADDAFTGNTQRVLGTEGGFDFSSGVLTSRDRSNPRQVVHPGHLPETNLALEAFARSVRSGGSTPGPVSLADARAATQFGMLVRLAVDSRRVVEWDEVG